MLKVFIYCLIKATHKDRNQRIGRQTIKLGPGQFVFGRKVASVELSMPESTLRDYMNMLEEDGVITISSTNKFSVVTVDNWEVYQSDEEKTDNKRTTNKQQTDSKRTTDGQQMDTNKNVKNVKNDKNNKDSRKRVYDESSLYYKITAYPFLINSFPPAAVK